MRTVVRLEEAALALFGLYLFTGLGFAWWWFPLLFFAPDLSMLGYLAGPRVGAYVYNFAHHKALAVALFVAGAWLANPPLQLAGVIGLAHSSFDRVLGYGLKYPDSFQSTHLGGIGKAAH